MKYLAVTLVFTLIACSKPQANSEERSQRPSLSSSQIFELRTKCQAIVDNDEEKYHLSDEVGAAGQRSIQTSSHYNPVTNHCYVKFDVTVSNIRTVALYDAQTRKSLMYFQQRNGEPYTAYDFTHRLLPVDFDHVSNEISRLMSEE